MYYKRTFFLIGLGLSLGSIAYADSVSFEHKDWQLVCDNTRTCRAVGYSPDDAENRVSVLLTRKAGIGQEVLPRVKFSDISGGGNETNLIPDKIMLKIDDKSYGEIGSLSQQDITNESGTRSLNVKQTKALLLALKGTSKIAFWGEGKEWVLPGEGATAVLLKMDDAQGRIGTPSALIKKGNKSENRVLPALPMPIVYKKSLPKEDVKRWQSKVNWEVLRRELPSGKELMDDNFCSLLTDGDSKYNKFNPKVIAVLPNNHLLVNGLCMRGAYNEAYGYWIINQKQPYKPKLITTMADDEVEGSSSNNEILFSARGRGLGDCMSRISWVWNGEDFVKTYDGNSGMCRMIILGGAWDLPTYVAKVR